MTNRSNTYLRLGRQALRLIRLGILSNDNLIGYWNIEIKPCVSDCDCINLLAKTWNDEEDETEDNDAVEDPCGKSDERTDVTVTFQPDWVQIADGMWRNKGHRGNIKPL